MSDSDDKKVVFLAYRNTTPTASTEEVLACGVCQNKTWKAVYRPAGGFPVLRCACCGYEAGYFGWAPEPDA